MFESEELLLDPSSFDRKYPKDPLYVKEIREFVNDVTRLQRKNNEKHNQIKALQSNFNKSTN
jgi:predicted RNase H-like nuclease (RuvC/YqgF family)